jgi:hypothetical protein
MQSAMVYPVLFSPSIMRHFRQALTHIQLGMRRMLSRYGKYYALREEANDVVVESQRCWKDTPSSAFAIQCDFFHPSYFLQLIYCGFQLSAHLKVLRTCSSFATLVKELRAPSIRISSQESQIPNTVKSVAITHRGSLGHRWLLSIVSTHCYTESRRAKQRYAT